CALALAPGSPPVVPPFLSHLPPPPQLYPLSLHDALPILSPAAIRMPRQFIGRRRSDRVAFAISELDARTIPSAAHRRVRPEKLGDRKSTRLNSSHVKISYAVFCLKKKNPPGDHDATANAP